MRITLDPSPFPIENPASDLGKQAADLHAEWVRQHSRIDTIEADRSQAQAAVAAADAELGKVLYEAELAGGEATKPVKDAEAALADARQRLDSPWTQRYSAAQAASETARVAFEVFVNEHLDALLQEPELAGAADEVALSIEGAARALGNALAEWRAVKERHSVLLSSAEGIDSRSLPELNGGLRDVILGLDRFWLQREGGLGLPKPRPDKRDLARRGSAEIEVATGV